MDNAFQLKSTFSPCGDQPQAIEHLVSGLREGKRAQVLLGITGSGKTFTIANVIAKYQKPTLIIAHNKTLAAQLYQEFKAFFPDNAVEYFVSYYDYYQPEAYIARTDTYIEKDFAINDQIDRLRLSATRSLIERKDVIIIASISCIYGLGTPEYYAKMLIRLRMGERHRRDDLLLRFVHMHYKRSDLDLLRSSFRVRGDVIEIMPAYEEDLAYRIEFFGNDIERIRSIDPLTGKVRATLEEFVLYPGSHYVTPEEIRLAALETIKAELNERIAHFESENRLVEGARIRERTLYDMEMIKTIGFCKGIENYSRHFSQRSSGEPPPCLLDYFPKDFLLVIDESHQTLPQMHAMYNGDRSRKLSLVAFGFRLPSAFDNRPLKFEEAYEHFHHVIYVSATPGSFEIQEAGGDVVQQILRPTGLLDPEIVLKPASQQIDDCLEQIQQEIECGGRILVTVLTKRLAEDLSKYLQEINVRAKYLHSDIDTLERVHILNDLRRGTFDVLVGINLLREGLDLPEVSLVCILDADKEGFLRSQTALIQTCGRAARNERGRVVMYADKETPSIRNCIAITHERRAIQQEYNKKHGISPRTAKRAPIEDMVPPLEETTDAQQKPLLSSMEIDKKMRETERAMRRAAKEMHFEEAARLRDELKRYQALRIVE